MEAQALEIIDGQVENLTVRRKPSVVLEEAREAATALQAVISGKPKKVMFNGEQYLEFEDWQTIARFYGLTSEVESTSFVDYGGVKGFSARAIVKRSDGVQISAAEAECLNDEEKWGTRPKYEWRDKDGGGRERVKIGEEHVPLFQLKSMAQTRAQAKALRNVLSWVVVLAGYKATPAEELPVEEVANTSHGAGSTAGAAKPQVNADGSTKVKTVTDKPGEKKPGHVIFEDGRDLSTFDDEVLKKAKEALAGGWTVVPTIETKKKGDKTYHNLMELERVVVQAQELPLEDTEPVGQPEKVLITKHETPEGKEPYWKIQTDRRLYVTNTKLAFDVAEEAKKKGVKVLVKFEAKKTTGGVFNVIETIEEAPAA